MKVSDLPLEILTEIFLYVKSNEDLLECQITCQLWYQASAESLYQSIYFGSEPRTSALMRTLSAVPNLGKLVKNVQFTRGKANLNTPSAQLLLQLCPNIENISAFKPDDAFWKGLVEATHQGQLSCLQRLPDPHSGSIESMESYLNTALGFQRTLKQLVYDQMTHSESMGDIYLKIYNKLAQNLKHFSQLQDLKVVRVSSRFGRGLCDIDALIEDVPQLKILTAVFYPPQHLKVIVPTHVYASINSSPIEGDIFTLATQIMKPRPDIKSFFGIWESMNTDEVIIYFMEKFTKLNMINIGYIRDPQQFYDISLPVIYKFIEYLSKIPSVKVECALKKKAAMDAWIQFIQSSSSGKSIGITYEWVRDLDHYKLTFRKKKNTNLTVTISYPEGSSMDLPHKEVLEKAGEQLEIIQISNIQNIQRVVPSRNENIEQHDMAYGHWLTHLLNNCPSLKELLIYTPGKIRFSSSKIERHYALEKLTISHVYAEIGDTVLPYLSERLPSLKHLDLFYFGERNEVTTIKMPKSSLDTITWGKRSHYVGIGTLTFQEDWKFYLKAQTATQEQYFMGDKTRLYPSNQEAYTNALQEHQCFDILCKSIHHLIIQYKDSFVDQKYILNMN